MPQELKFVLDIPLDQMVITLLYEIVHHLNKLKQPPVTIGRVRRGGSLVPGWEHPPLGPKSIIAAAGAAIAETRLDSTITNTACHLAMPRTLAKVWCDARLQRRSLYTL